MDYPSYARELSKAVAIQQTGEWYEQAAALIVVILMASFGGILMQVMMKGGRVVTGTIDWSFPKPGCNAVSIPPLVGMIVAGCLARNYLCKAYMDHFPEEVASWIRVICLSIILLIGGLELSFEGKGLTMVLLTLLPQLFEATGVAVSTKLLLGYPWPLCFSHGFTLAAVSPAVIVPSMMNLYRAGYGVKKGIPTSMIAASSFDDIIAITAFGILTQIAFAQVQPPLAEGEVAPEPKNIGLEILFSVAQLVVGILLGLFLGWTFKCFDKLPKNACRMWVKLLMVMIVAVAFPIVSEITTFRESKSVGIIFFGYACYRVWGEDKPEHELGHIWRFCQPCLFGTIGAAVQFKDIDGAGIGVGLGIIFIGLAFRWIGAFLAMMEPKYTIKEKIFVAFGWIPKATVQAVLAGVTLNEANKSQNEDYIRYGKAMLTMAVFAICIAAPLGAILIATLGPKCLENDGLDLTCYMGGPEGDAAADEPAKEGLELEDINADKKDKVDEQDKPETVKVEADEAQM